MSPQNRTYSIKTILALVDRMSAPAAGIARAIEHGPLGKLRLLRTEALAATASLRGTLGGLLSFAGKAAALAGAGGIVGGALFAPDALRSVADGSKALLRLSTATGTAVNDLQTLHYAATRSGLSVEQFNQGYVKFATNLGRMRGGKGELLENLRKMSPILQKQLEATTSVSQAWDVYMAAMAKVTDEEKRLGLATAAFGESGAPFAAMVAEGTEGLAALRAEAEKYGLLTEEQVRKNAEAATAMTNLKLAIAGVTQQIMARLGPALTPLIQRMADWATKNRDLIATKVEAFIEKLPAAIDAVSAAAQKVWDTFGGWEGISKGLKLALEALAVYGVAVIAGKVLQLVTALGKLALLVKTNPWMLALGGLAYMAYQLAEKGPGTSALSGYSSYSSVGARAGTFDETQPVSEAAPLYQSTAPAGDTMSMADDYGQQSRAFSPSGAPVPAFMTRPAPDGTLAITVNAAPGAEVRVDKAQMSGMDLSLDVGRNTVGATP